MIRVLASPRLTLGGFAVLALAVLAHVGVPAWPSWLLSLPLATLAVNLAAALAMRPGLRASPGLFGFHLALLVLLGLAGWGRLTHLDGRVELVEGQGFADAHAEILQRGPWHRDRLDELDFVQGRYTVDYRPGLRRAHTRSEVWLDGRRATVGDIEPLVLSGYRFYTTHNKGYALVVTWLPATGPAATGALHLPSFPMHDWRQTQRWQPPGAPALELTLDPGIRLDYLQPWQLDSRQLRPLLRLAGPGGERRLRPGETVAIEGGRLRFEGVRGWMGYRIFYDPTLPWLLAWAAGAVCALAWHLLGRLRLPALTMRRTHERTA